MLKAYVNLSAGLTLMPPEGDLAQAVWIDLLQPSQAEIDAVGKLGVDVPSLEDMEEIEISNRLYVQGDVAYMTGVFPGGNAEGNPVVMPVSFILTQQHLVTVRHHSPRPFDTYPARADKGNAGCSASENIFLGLAEEMVARLADLSEGVGHVIDQTTLNIFADSADSRGAFFQTTLRTIGRQSESMSRVRLGLLSMDRILSFHASLIDARPNSKKLQVVTRSIQRDVQALEVNVDFLSARINMALDATLGMVSMQQNNTVRILSVVAALFLPPMLIASIYGMNFEGMPELKWRYGYAYGLGMMVLSVVAAWLFLRWKKWL